jgi:hypothetical protein
MAIPSNHSSREAKESKRRYYAPRGYSLYNEAVFWGGKGKSNLTSSTISRSRLSSFSTWATLGARVYQRIDHRQCGAVRTRLNIRMYWHCTQRRLAWLVSDLHSGCYWPIGIIITRSLCGPILTSCWRRLLNGFNLDSGQPGLTVAKPRDALREYDASLLKPTLWVPGADIRSDSYHEGAGVSAAPVSSHGSHSTAARR